MAKFNDFLKKAEKRTRQIPDYEIELEGEIYKIPYPDSLQMLEFSDLDDDAMLQQLKVIFRKVPDAWNALVRELEGTDPAVLQVIVEDIFRFWRQGNLTPGK